MMNWFRLFRLPNFDDLGLTSTQISVALEGYGLHDILICKGNETSILYEGVFLTINMNGKNAFRLDDNAVYLDSNDDVWLGIYEN